MQLSRRNLLGALLALPCGRRLQTTAAPRSTSVSLAPVIEQALRNVQRELGPHGVFLERAIEKWSHRSALASIGEDA
jgi:hypothetical protein